MAGLTLQDWDQADSQKPHEYQRNIVENIFGAPINLLQQLGEADRIANTKQSAPMFMTDSQYQRFKSNPGLEVGKSLAGTAAFLVPGSAGLKGATLAAGLAGFGNSKSTDLPGLVKDTAIGAGTGFATAGLLKLATGGGINKLKNAVTGKSNTAINSLRKQYGVNIANFGSPQEADNVVSTVDGLLKNNGLKTNTRQNIAYSVQGLKDTVGQRFDDLTAPIAFTADDANSVVSGFNEQLKNAPALRNSDTAMELLTDIQDAAKAGNLSVLKDVESKINQMSFGSISKKIGAQVELTDRQRVFDAMRSSINQFIKSNPALENSDIRDVYNAWSALTRVQPYVNKFADKAVKTPILNKVGLNLNAAPITDRLRSGYNNILRGFGGTAQNTTSQPGAVKSFLNNYGSNLAGLSAVGLLPGFSGNQQSNSYNQSTDGSNSLPLGVDPMMYGYPEDQTVRFPSGESAVGYQQQSLPGFGVTQSAQSKQDGMRQQAIEERSRIAQELLNQVDSKGKNVYSPTQALKEAEAMLSIGYGISPEIFKETTPKEQKLTEKQNQYLSAAETASMALQLLESGKVGTGKVSSLGNKFGQFFGTQSDEQTDYLSKLAGARGIAINALSGANVPPSEYQRIAAMIPVETDEPKIAKQKLRSFIEAMKVYSRREVSQPSISVQQSGDYSGGSVLPGLGY